ncbi:MAG: 50S ribosomal protein L4 [Nanoarchaeota archaeon]
MKTKLFDKNAKAIKELELPKNFSEEIREDIMIKAFEAEKRKMPMGNYLLAGDQYSASGILRRKRHAWKGTYGRGISRVPRKIMSRRGSSFNWVGATVASARGGRRAHPPKVEENQFKKINKKELRIAFNSGFSGTMSSKYLELKYNRKNGISSIIIDSDILSVKTKEFIEILKRIYGDNFNIVMQRKTIRSGRGKTRGRKYKKNAGILFVIASEENMKRKGIEVKKVKELKLKDLAPNGVPGRLTCYTEKAIKEIGETFK